MFSLLDPVRGLAMIPFRKEDDLAWYVLISSHRAASSVGAATTTDRQCRPDLIPEATIGENGVA